MDTPAGTPPIEPPARSGSATAPRLGSLKTETGTPGVPRAKTASLPETASFPKIAFPPRAGRMHTRTQALAFVAKAWVFRLHRLWLDIRSGPAKLPTNALSRASEFRTVAGESHASLYPSSNPAEFALQAGKVHNLRVAASYLHGIHLPANAVFSFWRQIPRPTRRRGFVAGRELREGCIVPSVGGGLCQLSNALYDAALRAGCEILERHPHSMILPGSMAQAGRDATVFWNYVDLRFRSEHPLQIMVHLTGTELVVRLLRPEPVSVRCPKPATIPIQALRSAVESCETCGITQCFRHLEPGALPGAGVTAWLVDAWWPEFDLYLTRNRTVQDWMFVPLSLGRFSRHGVLRSIGSKYPWCTAAFARVCQAPLEVLWRSWGSRRLASQGAERQKALLAFDQRLARRYARQLPYTATHLVISQNLLPYLWQDGVLGGRTFDVLMTRSPMAALQAQLDRAQACHPESPTLADFRADPALLEAESAALAAARHWITPHSQVAALAGSRAVKLDWCLPDPPTSAQRGTRTVFPSSTLGRKGAYEVREVARQLGPEIVLGGPVIERADFWKATPVLAAGGNWLEGAGVVILPAWVEHQPRRLLAAVAAGVPVIASRACGLEGIPGVVSVPEGDIAALSQAIQQLTSRSS